VIVLDTSVAFEVLAQSETGLAAEQFFRTGGSLHAPHLLDAELAHILRRQVRFGMLSPSKAMELIDKLRALRLVRHSHLPLLDRVWSLRDNLTAYDACFIALTEQLDATLLTRDAAFKSVRLRAGRVKVFG
jgi:predicted nucleic acid-binding protein